ncbi:30S ribosome-binding factor RbfA [Zymomonas mobilis]|uniref:Ribosome-binding factor A n=1 Tax=Zymomonas mobilis subsp. pomaceae (strain ATCC 29192 / DSM 22645 / JCM 10191 / CCUG 17912 / NBRC 13757 / NCIMB 11200 / NRRL B-4491 / Barker I) TaxID=579138 RepID=F8ERY9_ZYMMT|nr:30S ribosome-binding factor RbfA [Zymomonas mobilis]AEI37564.1 ribosome-binding factor A [Zymomonas mobilis subsp. pomaceae ATCC 29192]MDX5948932.1 30S ribosome-binding factor RbfA [Zymomonas mobilis subsp. pomaceae]GEB88737.1 ribosome-binding factor A [Zymomonas mobilis subsp. pomaceae]
MRRNQTPEGHSIRPLRVGEQIRHVLAEMLMRGEVHGDSLDNLMVSISEVRMTPDLRIATVFVKSLGGVADETVISTLSKNATFLQRAIGQKIRLKYVPRLRFLADESFEQGSLIDHLLRSPHVARDLQEDDKDMPDSVSKNKE